MFLAIEKTDTELLPHGLKFPEVDYGEQITGDHHKALIEAKRLIDTNSTYIHKTTVWLLIQNSDIKNSTGDLLENKDLIKDEKYYDEVINEAFSNIPENHEHYYITYYKLYEKRKDAKDLLLKGVKRNSGLAFLILMQILIKKAREKFSFVKMRLVNVFWIPAFAGMTQRSQKINIPYVSLKLLLVVCLRSIVFKKPCNHGSVMHQEAIVGLSLSSIPSNLNTFSAISLKPKSSAPADIHDNNGSV